MQVRPHTRQADVPCPDCGDMFNVEREGTWVRTSRRRGKEVCERCRHEYRFDCGVCGEWCDKDPEANDVGSDVFVMVRTCLASGGADLEPGLYRILRGPFFGGPIIGELHLFDDRIQRLGALPENTAIPEDGAACAPVCEDCQRKLLGRVRHMRRLPKSRTA